MKMALFVLLLSVAGLLLAAGAVLLWLGTDTGRTWLTTEIENRSAGALHIEQLKAILSPRGRPTGFYMLMQAAGLRSMVWKWPGVPGNC